MADLIQQITVPVAVVYGTADSVVPPEQSRAVVARAGGPTRLIEVPGANHNDAVLLNGPPIIDAVLAVSASIKGA